MQRVRKPGRLVTLGVVLLALLTFTPWASTLDAAVTYINSSTGSNLATQAPTLATNAVSLTAGNLNVACVRLFTSNPTGATDTAGNTYTQATFQTTGSDDLEIWYVKNALGNASNSVTFSFSGAGTFYVETVTAQYSGIVTGTAFDTTAAGVNTSGATSTTSAFTTTSASELIVACADVGGNTTLGAWSGTGLTMRVTSTGGTMALGDKSVSSIQTAATQSMTNAGTGLTNNKIVLSTFVAKTSACGGLMLLGVGC